MNYYCNINKQFIPNNICLSYKMQVEDHQDNNPQQPQPTSQPPLQPLPSSDDQNQQQQDKDNQRQADPQKDGKDDQKQQTKKDKKKKKNKHRRNKEEDEEKEKEKYEEAVKNSFLHSVTSLTPEERQKYAEIQNDPMKMIVTNLPLKITVPEIHEYFNQAIISYDSDLAEPLPIRNVEIDTYRTFAVLELSQRRIKDYFTKHTDFVYAKANAVFKVMRPKAFFEEKYKEKDKTGLAFVQGERLYIGGLPSYFSDEQVKKIVQTFGRLKYVTVIKENGVSKGYGFFEYEDPASSDKAIEALNNLPVADRKLKCQKASIGGGGAKSISLTYAVGGQVVQGEETKRPANHSGSYLVSYPNIQNPDVQITLLNNYDCKVHSRVVQFLNMFYIEDLFDEESYENLTSDLREECEKYGPIEKIVIPRPDPICGYSSPTVGKAFVKFMYIIAAKRARVAIAGKVYNKRTIVTSFYPQEKFNSRQYLVVP